MNTTLGTNITNLAPNNLPRQDLVAAFLTGFKGLNQQKMVTPSEMMRLNTAVPPTPRNKQSTFGVAGGDLAGFPNGRRPGDDAVDLALRVVMGRLCYDLPIGKALGRRRTTSTSASATRATRRSATCRSPTARRSARPS